MSVVHPDEFDYGYYDYTNYGRAEQPGNDGSISHGPSWQSLTRIVLVILLRAGFVLIHVGSVPVNNVNLILLQNLVDFCWVTVAYFLVGFLVAYNGDVHGLVGEGYWIGNVDVDKEEAIIGWSAVAIAAAICTSGIVGRTHTVGYLVIGSLLTGLLQPLVIHWIWTPRGWMRKGRLHGTDVKFQDYAGSTVVHLVGGVSGLIGCMTLGRRILQLSAIDDASIGAGSAGTVFAGQLMVFIGLQSLNMPHVHSEKFRIRSGRHCNVYLNNLLAASSCSLMVVAFHFVLGGEEFNHWTLMRCVQATIAGLATVSAGTNVYSPQVAIALGVTGSVVFYLVSKRVFRSALEDYCNIVAIHVACACLGSFLAPFFDVESDMDVNLILLNVSWQLICLIAVISFVAIAMGVAFASLQLAGMLRNRSEYLNHMRASLVAEAGPPRSYLQRLFFPDNNPVYLQPGSTTTTERRPSILKNKTGAEQNKSGVASGSGGKPT